MVARHSTGTRGTDTVQHSSNGSCITMACCVQSTAVVCHLSAKECRARTAFSLHRTVDRPTSPRLCSSMCLITASGRSGKTRGTRRCYGPWPTRASMHSVADSLTGRAFLHGGFVRARFAKHLPPDLQISKPKGAVDWGCCCPHRPPRIPRARARSRRWLRRAAAPMSIRTALSSLPNATITTTLRMSSKSSNEPASRSSCRHSKTCTLCDTCTISSVLQ